MNETSGAASAINEANAGNTTATTDEGHPGAFRRGLNVIDDRMGLNALRYPVPGHANTLGWSLGALTLISFVVLLVTGVIIIQFYSSDPIQANQSVRNLATEVAGGSFVRGLHYWASQAMYILAGLHLIRIFLTASFKRPREGNWLIGVAMLALTFVAIFTGTVLKWDQEGFEALIHNIEAVRLLGPLGYFFTPEFAPDISILQRVYAAHIVILPGLILLALVIHLLLVKFHKVSPHPLLPGEVDGQAPASEPTESFDGHLRRAFAFGLILVGVLGLLALLLPPLIGSTPVAGVELTVPVWQYWAVFALENWFGISAILWGVALMFGLLALVPFLDRSPERSPARRKRAIIIGAILLLTYFVLTFLVLVLPAKQHIGM